MRCLLGSRLEGLGVESGNRLKLGCFFSPHLADNNIIQKCYKQAADLGHNLLCTVPQGGDVKHCQAITPGIRLSSAQAPAQGALTALRSPPSRAPSCRSVITPIPSRQYDQRGRRHGASLSEVAPSPPDAFICTALHAPYPGLIERLRVREHCRIVQAGEPTLVGYRRQTSMA